MTVKQIFLCCALVLICHASTIKVKPSIQLKLKNPGNISSTSPTISVQRFGGSTFYGYVKSVPTTTVSSEAPEEETQTEVPIAASSSPVASEQIGVVSLRNDANGNDDESDEGVEDVVFGETEDDAKTPETTLATTINPEAAAAVEDARTEIPASAADSSGGVDSGSPAAGGDDGAASPSLPGGDSEDSGDGNGGNLPSEPTPAPGEAVPGQPGEAGADSSSSSEESNSSSSEEFKEAYNKKAWEFKSKSKLESLAKVHNKFMKKDKTIKYSY